MNKGSRMFHLTLKNNFIQMKHIFLFLFLFAYSSVLFSQNKVLFEIGQQNGSASEFALYPNHYDSFLAGFGGEKFYHVGFSTPDKHWPYVLPGPLDNWAGGGYWAGYHPRHFPSVVFSVGQTTERGTCTLSLIFVGVNNEKPVKIRVEVNGHRFEEEVIGKDNKALLQGDVTAGTQKEIRVEFPAFWLNKGMNRIQLGAIAGSCQYSIASAWKHRRLSPWKKHLPH